jgi:hypothetical protein
MTHAELTWVESTLEALRDGSFTWDQEELAKLAAAQR